MPGACALVGSRWRHLIYAGAFRGFKQSLRRFGACTLRGFGLLICALKEAAAVEIREFGKRDGEDQALGRRLTEMYCMFGLKAVDKA